MNAVEEVPAAEAEIMETDEFTALVDTLRRDFHRVFPHLRPKENECFFVQRNDNQTSGKVWIDFLRANEGRNLACKITIIIEGNRAVRRIQDEVELEEQPEGTAFHFPL